MRANNKNLIFIRKRLTSVGAGAESLTSYAKGRGIYAAVMPFGGGLTGEAYGEGTNKRLKILLDNDEEICTGDGVTVYAPLDKEPDYKAIALNTWPRHLEVILEELL